MKKKQWLSISVFLLVNIVILSMALQHVRQASHAPQSKTEKLTFLGVAPGITTNEVRDATNVLAHERQMWAQFKGLSAAIEVEYCDYHGATNSLSGRIDLHQAGQSTKLLPRYSLLISNPVAGWVVQTDGTTSNFLTPPKDTRIADTIKAIDVGNILQTLTAPQYMLLTFFAEKPCSLTWVTLNDVLTVCPPWRCTNTNAPPHSYAFFGTIGNAQLTFTSGHLSEWQVFRFEGEQKTLTRMLAISFSNPIESSNLWYPTTIRAPVPWPYPAMAKGWLNVLPPGPPGSPLRSPIKPLGQITITLTDLSIKS